MSSLKQIVRSAGKKHQGRTPVSPSDSVKAVMVQITWTSAPVVRITVNKAIKIDCQQVVVLRGDYTPLRNAKMEIAAGKMIHFVRCEGRPGWYYLVNAGHCTCTAHWNPQSRGCKHLDAVQVFCEQADARELQQAGEGAQVEMMEVKRADGYVYPMFHIVSPSYIGRLHFIWNDDGTTCRYKSDELIDAEVLRIVDRAGTGVLNVERVADTAGLSVKALLESFRRIAATGRYLKPAGWSNAWIVRSEFKSA